MKTLADCEKELEICEEDPYEYFKSRDFRKIEIFCHPDKWLNEPIWAKRLFVRFDELFEQSKKSVMIGDYRVVKKIADGDLCEVSVGKKEGETFIIKTPKVKAKTFIKKEFDTCLWLSGEKSVYGKFFPVPVEISGDFSIYIYEENLISGSKVIQLYGDSLNSRHIVWMFKRTLMALGFIHHNGIVHGAITPEHLLFNKVNHGLKICGWIHSGKEGNKIEVVPAKYKHYYPPSTVKDKKLTKSLDLYMAAKSMLDIGGINLHRKLKKFLEACLLPGNMSPDDAWKIHDELKELSVDIFGNSKFVEL